MATSIVARLLSADDIQGFAKCGAAINAIGFGKSAAGVAEALDLGGKGILYGSVITGIPVGIMAHMVHRKIKDKRMKERELDQQIEYYRNATSGVERGLAGMGVKSSADAALVNYGKAVGGDMRLESYRLAKQDRDAAHASAGVAAGNQLQALRESTGPAGAKYIRRAGGVADDAASDLRNAEGAVRRLRNVDNMTPAPAPGLFQRVRNAFSTQ